MPFMSGASMNPAQSLAPALVLWALTDLWFYWSATFVWTVIVAFALPRKMVEKMDEDTYKSRLNLHAK